MRDYAELVKALRRCADGICRDCPRLQTPEGEFECKYKLRIDAADAIEELVAENAKLNEFTTHLLTDDDDPLEEA